MPPWHIEHLRRQTNSAKDRMERHTRWRFLCSKTRGLSVFALHECIAAWLGGLLICLHICGANNVLTTRWHHTDVRRICLFWPMNINAKRFVSSRLQQALAFCRHSFTPAHTCFLYLCTALFFIRFLSPLFILLFDQVICFISLCAGNTCSNWEMFHFCFSKGVIFVGLCILFHKMWRKACKPSAVQ